MLTKITTKFKKFISVLVCAMMVSLTFPVNMLSSAVYSEDDIAYAENQTTAVPCEDEDIELNGGDGDVVEVSTLTELQKAISNAQPGVQTAIALTKDIKTSNGFFSSPEYSLECDETSGKKTIKITSKDPASPRTITLGSSKSGLLRVKNSNVTLENINIIGTAEKANFGVSEDKYQKSAIRVEGGSITIGDDVKFSQYSTQSKGGFICCDKGTVNIQGGEFSYCGTINSTGSVVYCSEGIVNVRGGYFHHCMAKLGIISSENSTVNIENGTFKSCCATVGSALYSNKDNAVNISGGNFENSTGTFIGAMSVTLLNMTGGNFTNGTVGAICVDGGSKFTMSGGTISGCQAKTRDPLGGAITVASGSKFTMTGGTISNCNAEKGGAISLIAGSSFTMTGGTIDNCYVHSSYDAHGGAIYLEAEKTTEHSYYNGFSTSYKNASTFTMKGGTISNCYAEAADSGRAKGGAIYVGEICEVRLEKGKIVNCYVKSQTRLSGFAEGSCIAVHNTATISVSPKNSGLLEITPLPDMDAYGENNNPQDAGGYEGICLGVDANDKSSKAQTKPIEIVEPSQNNNDSAISNGSAASSEESNLQGSEGQSDSNSETSTSATSEDYKKSDNDDEDDEDEDEDDDDEEGSDNHLFSNTYSDTDALHNQKLRLFAYNQLEADGGMSCIVQLDEANGIVLTAKDGIIPPGYHFVAEKIQEGSNEWNDRIKNLDDNQKDDIEKIGIYEMSIKNSSGQTFTLPENKTVRIFMPCPAGWDKNDLQVVHISAGLDEDFTEEITTVNGQHYCTFKTTHFSPYAIIDEISKNDIFEMMAPWLIGAAVIAIGAVAAVVIVLKNKNKSRA